MEQQFIREILEGNPSGFSYFVTTYKHMAYTIAYRILRNREDAEEIVQDSFIKAFNALRTFRKESKFSTWFFRIVVNTALTHRRNVLHEEQNSKEYEDTSEQIDSLENAHKNLARTDREKYIRLALDHLGPEDGLLLTLFYLNENTLEEINEITGTKVPNLKMKLLRARKKMFSVLHALLQSETYSLL